MPSSSYSKNILFFLLVFVVACGSASPESKVDNAFQEDITDPRVATISHWKTIPDKEDPYKKPESAVVCKKGSDFFVENLGGVQVFAVKTDNCDYLTAYQLSRRSIKKGDELLIRLYIFDLIKPEGAEAFLSLRIEDQVIWEKRYPIPSPSGFEKQYWTAPKDFPLNSKIYFHVNNHFLY